MSRQRDLHLIFNFNGILLYLFSRFRDSQTYFHRFAQHLLGKLSNLRRHSCRKQQCLSVNWQTIDNIHYRRGKSHIKHTVSFVKNQKTYFAEINIAQVQMRRETPRCSHHNISTLLKRFALYLHRLSIAPTVHSNGATVGKIRKAFKLLIYLDCQLARRLDNQCVNTIIRLGYQLIENRQ